MAVTLWRYALPSIRGEGWAIIVIGSDGFFAAVSDWGNYGNRWPAPGVDDFRTFFLRDPREYASYFAEKLSPGRRHYDGDATRDNLKRLIIDARRANRLESDEARGEWELLVQNAPLWRARRASEMAKENAQMFPPSALLDRLLVPPLGTMSTTIHIRELGACGHDECREYPAMDAACYAARRVYARTYPALCDVRVGDDVRELRREPAPRVFAAQFVRSILDFARGLVEPALGPTAYLTLPVAYGNKTVTLCKRCAKRFAAAYAKRANVSGAG